MLRFAVIALLAAACAAQEQTCGQNEVFNACGSACPRTCALPDGALICTKQCVVGCECAPGFVRDETTGACVQLEDCARQEKCGPNESFYSCGTACPPTCSNPSPKICTMQCVAECQCQPGFVRDDATRQCVKKEDCSVSECPKNAIFKSCGSMCPKKCSQRGPVPCPRICVAGCECAAGLLKEDATGECVKEEECQQEECERRTERYDRCSKACEKTCDNPDSLICPMVCWGGCVCQDGLFRHSNGKCVKREECPAKQPEACTNDNEEFKECGPLGTPTCTIPVPFFSLRCRRGCHCKKNTYRNEKGTCVTSDECGAEKKCLRKQLEATGGPQRIGAFTPSCKADGSFEERQCHGSTGMCWCVDASGVEIDGTRKGPGSEFVECAKH